MLLLLGHGGQVCLQIWLWPIIQFTINEGWNSFAQHFGMDSEIIIIIKYSRQQTPSLFSTLNTKKKKKEGHWIVRTKKKKI